MVDIKDKTVSWARIILLIVLGIVAASFVLPAAAVYASVIGDWANDPRGFYGIEGAVNWVFGVIAALVLAGGLVLVGIMFRILPARWAPLASLGLAILGAGFIIATYLIFSDTNTTPDSIEKVLLQMASIVLLVLVALPPFLHWAMAKPAALPAPTEPLP